MGHFDLIIVGGGPGGYEAAIRGSQLGLNVALIEKDKMGGTCLNRGCIPTKAFVHSADFLRNLKISRKLAIDTGELNIDIPKLVYNKDKIVRSLVSGVEYLMKKNKVTVFHCEAEFLDSGHSVDESGAAACYDAFLNGCLGSCESVLDAELLLLHLDLGSSADLDNGYAACQLGKPLLELLAVEVGGGLLDLSADLSYTVLDLGLVAGTVNDDGVFLLNNYLTGSAQLIHSGLGELEADLLADDLTAGKNGDILEHFLSSVAEAGSLYCNAGEGAAELVYDKGGESLALNVLSDDEAGNSLRNSGR